MGLGLNVSGVRRVTVALSQALDLALGNVPKLPKTLIAIDESGSMEGKQSKIASQFGAILVKTNLDADLLTFAEGARYQNINPLDSTMTIARNISFEGGGTNFSTIFGVAKNGYERIIILSDMQGWLEDYNLRSKVAEYKKLNPEVKIYSWDLRNSGAMQFPENNVYSLAGWSDKVFDIIKMLETDKKSLLNEIEKIEL